MKLIFILIFTFSCLPEHKQSLTLQTKEEKGAESQLRAKQKLVRIGSFKIMQHYLDGSQLLKHNTIKLVKFKGKTYELFYPKHFDELLKVGSTIRFSYAIPQKMSLNKFHVMRVKQIYQLEAPSPLPEVHTHKRKIKKIESKNFATILIRSQHYEVHEDINTWMQNVETFLRNQLKVSTHQEYDVGSYETYEVTLSESQDNSSFNYSDRSNKAIQILLERGVDLDKNFDYLIFLTDIPAQFGGLGSIPGFGSTETQQMWMKPYGMDVPLNSPRMKTIMHELGHNLGFHHASIHEPRLDSYDSETHIEYGDRTAVMGSYACTKLDNMSYIGPNAARAFLKDKVDKGYLKIDASTIGSKTYDFTFINDAKVLGSQSTLKVLTFREKIKSSTTDLKYNSDFFISFVKTCSQSGVGLFHVMIHHIDNNFSQRSFLVKELNIGESFTVGSTKINFQSFNFQTNIAKVKIN